MALYPALVGAKALIRCLTSLSLDPQKTQRTRKLWHFSCVAENLKIEPNSADAIGMFMTSTSDPPVSERAIVAFCAAMNTPVVNIEDLEVGPARAAIMLSADDYGELSLLVRVCLISSGEGATFRFQGDIGRFGSSSGAMGAALGFAEGMGFLLDDDLLTQGGPSGRVRAFRIWSSLFDAGAREGVGAGSDEELSADQAELGGREFDGNDWIDAEAEPVEGMGSGELTVVSRELELTDDLVLVDEYIDSDDSDDSDAFEGTRDCTADWTLDADSAADEDGGEAAPEAATEANRETFGLAREALLEESGDLPAVACGSPLLTKFRAAGSDLRSGRPTERRSSAVTDRRVSTKGDRRQQDAESPSSSIGAGGKDGFEGQAVEFARTRLVAQPLGAEIEDQTGFYTRLLSSF